MGIGYIRSDLVTLSQIHGDKCWPTVDKVSPCEEVCPIHMDIPSYIMALAQGQFKEAIEVVRETNPFPSICGRVCHHPCEDACNRSLVDGPIAIEYLKRFVGEYEQATNGMPEPAKRTKEERVAVIGSGPAGLTAAYDLVKEGYGVCVYEALPVAGGMLAAGIPEFVLPMKTVKAEVDYIRALGVDIKTNIRIGQDLTIEELQNQGFKAILLATGAWKSAQLQIPGVELKGVTQALDILRDAKLGEKIILKGTVIVIGGGNVAVDTARTAVRLGAEKVILTCLESRAEMPAFEWEVETAEQEGVEILPLLAPQQINSRPVNKVGSIDFKKVASVSKDSDGRFSWTLEEGSDSDVTLEAGTVIVAIGQVPDPSFAEKVNTGGSGSFEVDPDTLTTNIEGIFAAGDSVKAPGTVVECIGAGHVAARSIDRFLKGEDMKADLPNEDVDVLYIEEEEIPTFMAKKERWDMPSISPKDSVRSFGETNLGYTEWQVREEAMRCLNCRMCGNCLFGRGQICFETSTRLLKKV